MNKQYIFKNAIIDVTYTNIPIHRIIKSTEVFMKKVLKEKERNGNTN